MSVITLLVRWESRVVLHYIKEAPLLALTSQARIKLQRHKITAVNPEAMACDLAGSVKNLGRRLTGLQAKLRHLAALSPGRLPVTKVTGHATWDDVRAQQVAHADKVGGGGDECADVSAGLGAGMHPATPRPTSSGS